jgi:hypothetical protein
MACLPLELLGVSNKELFTGLRAKYESLWANFQTETPSPYTFVTHYTTQQIPYMESLLFNSILDSEGFAYLPSSPNEDEFGIIIVHTDEYSSKLKKSLRSLVLKGLCDLTNTRLMLYSCMNFSEMIVLCSMNFNWYKELGRMYDTVILHNSLKEVS